MERDLPTIALNASIRDAMHVLDRAAVEIALVVEDGELVGTVTDGDIRRALLRGASLDSSIEPAMNRRFTAVPVGTNRAAVLDLMTARSLGQIPEVDSRGRLVGLHLMREIVGSVDRPNLAVIMAGGRGQRLRPLTDNVPKPMIQVAGRPILERIVLHLVGYGIRRVFLAINYLGEQIERHFADGSHFGCEIQYLRERKPLGTGGGLSLLAEAPEEPLLVMNGDLVTQFDVGQMLAHHQSCRTAVTVGVHEYIHRVPFGVVETDGDRITAQTEKPTVRCLANAGIYVIEPHLLGRVPSGCFYPLPSLVDECLERGESVRCFRIEDDWTDVGRPRELSLANGLDER